MATFALLLDRPGGGLSAIHAACSITGNAAGRQGLHKAFQRPRDLITALEQVGINQTRLDAPMRILNSGVGPTFLVISEPEALALGLLAELDDPGGMEIIHLILGQDQRGGILTEKGPRERYFRDIEELKRALLQAGIDPFRYRDLLHNLSRGLPIGLFVNALQLSAFYS